MYGIFLRFYCIQKKKIKKKTIECNPGIEGMEPQTHTPSLGWPAPATFQLTAKHANFLWTGFTVCNLFLLFMSVDV